MTSGVRAPVTETGQLPSLVDNRRGHRAMLEAGCETLRCPFSLVSGSLVELGDLHPEVC